MKAKTVLIFITLSLGMLIGLTYGFVQQVAATKNAEEANRQRILAETSEKQSKENAVEALRQRELADKARVELEDCKQAARKR